MKILHALFIFLLLANVAGASELNFCQNLLHQDFWHPLEIKICYETDEGSDPEQIHSSLEQFLQSYPNPADFWEVMNRKMAFFLVETYPKINRLDIEIAIAPDEMIPVPRKSILHYQGGRIKESFTFLLDNTRVYYNYKEDIQPHEYPDFLWIADAIETFEESKGAPLKQYLLEQFPMLTSIHVMEVAH